jgi:protein farnesyltransferase subunit beta
MFDSGVAALQILGKLDVLDLPALIGWLARRQMAFEGGFSGRSNKLVDGCYSFWQGGKAQSDVVGAYCCEQTISQCSFFKGAMAIVSMLYISGDDDEHDSLLFDTAMLQRYILLCAQDIHGGLRDKPSKSRDFYHSCYNLSGLSITGATGGKRVEKTHPSFNIREERVQEVLAMTW